MKCPKDISVLTGGLLSIGALIKDGGNMRPENHKEISALLSRLSVCALCCGGEQVICDDDANNVYG